jgi:hypothetical protein
MQNKENIIPINNINPNSDLLKEKIIIPPSPQVIVPPFNKEIITLEDSMHNNNEFQIVKPKRKNVQVNKNNNIKNNINTDQINQNNQINLINQKNQINSKDLLEKQVKSHNKEKQREKRLILQVPKEFSDNISPFALRNEINRSFINNNINKPVIASITKSQSNLSIIITTMNDFSAKYLIESKETWESLIPFTKYQFDEEWIKLIIHKVPTKPFECEEGLDLLKQEIEDYNDDIKLIRAPNWLTHEETRLQKNHSSIIIYLSDQARANSILNRKIFIAGELCKVEKHIPKFIQCEKCQQYGHTKYKCKNDYKCRICSKKHDTIGHYCTPCNTKDNCIHLPIKCANCGEAHKANSKICKEWIKVNPKNNKIIDQMDVN